MNTQTITISQNLIKEKNLVLVPRREYEQLFRFWTNAESVSKSVKKTVENGFREIAEGKFLTSKQVKNELGL